MDKDRWCYLFVWGILWKTVPLKQLVSHHVLMIFHQVSPKTIGFSSFSLLNGYNWGYSPFQTHPVRNGSKPICEFPYFIEDEYPYIPAMILGLFWPIHIFKSSKTLNPKLKQRETSQSLFLNHVFPPNLSSYMCHVIGESKVFGFTFFLRKHLLGEKQTLNKWRLLKLGDPIRHLNWLFGGPQF